MAVPSSAEVRRVPADEAQHRAFDVNVQHDRGKDGQGSQQNMVPALIVLNLEAQKGPICACECWV